MMLRDYIRFLYAYNAWANERVLDTCAQLTQEEFLAGQGSSTANPSIRDTLVHTMGSQEIWLARWGGISPQRLLDPQDFGTVALVREYWNQVEAHTKAYIDAVEDDSLEATMNYQNTHGDAFSNPLWQTAVHQVNHATQHRSEVAMLLTRMNHSPGELDVMGYIRGK